MSPSNTALFIGILLGGIWFLWSKVIILFGLPMLSYYQIFGLYVFATLLRILWSVELFAWSTKTKNSFPDMINEWEARKEEN